MLLRTPGLTAAIGGKVQLPCLSSQGRPNILVSGRDDVLDLLMMAGLALSQSQ